MPRSIFATLFSLLFFFFFFHPLYFFCPKRQPFLRRKISFLRQTRIGSKVLYISTHQKRAKLPRHAVEFCKKKKNSERSRLRRRLQCQTFVPSYGGFYPPIFIIIEAPPYWLQKLWRPTLTYTSALMLKLRTHSIPNLPPKSIFKRAS